VAPEIPTFKELGYASIEGSGWQAFHTTAGTPRAVVDRLGAAVADALRAPEVRDRLTAVGLQPVGSTPDELARRMSEERERWAPVVKATGFRADQ
jgi:tripartite-type tricarboxylate transporter receptor subunit TctC